MRSFLSLYCRSSFSSPLNSKHEDQAELFDEAEPILSETEQDESKDEKLESPASCPENDLTVDAQSPNCISNPSDHASHKSDNDNAGKTSATCTPTSENSETELCEIK